MGFRDNLLKRITINNLVRTIDRTIGTAESGTKVDKKSMKELLGMSTFVVHRERDMDLYIRPLNDKIHQILVLDNELPLFETSLDDVLLRRDPTLKEMISIRNALKILNDKDVVKFRRKTSLDFLHKDLLKDLDLTFSDEDLESIFNQAVKALADRDRDGIVEAIVLFSEILGYVPAIPAFEIRQHRVWGKSGSDIPGKTVFGPMVIYNPDTNRLVLWVESVEKLDPGAVESLFMEKNEQPSQWIQGPAVFEFLRDKARAQGFVAPMALN
ncbi:hypothetical protein HRM2_23430 [Desulforapulum autotrophicum HRM2]|uniref:Uncharacterized protein n=1 Tax=Desulforapulum autotrophicum (strain ATCC 43914 / DSM 3382 / VKM B-1955 / HRM2) TaxID=177437 RepID=C0QEU6_DESAH|nr:hypothetical protein [Desulforapulum autotrophicum]ACN15438.1 hypothetical protein HRM2_23430 [Desulforapulum autotrophicum HRM2]